MNSAAPRTGTHSDRPLRRPRGRLLNVTVWIAAVLTGALLGYLALYLWLYSTVRFGDDIPLLAPEGSAGTVVGWLMLTLPFLGVATALLLLRRVPAVAWFIALAIAVVVMALIPHPATIDCGNNITGYTCASGGNDPFSGG